MAPFIHLRSPSLNLGCRCRCELRSNWFGDLGGKIGLRFGRPDAARIAVLSELHFVYRSVIFSPAHLDSALFLPDIYFCDV